jgi:uncharacterized membrane protein YccC
MKRMKAIKQHCIYLAIFLALMFSATAVFAQEDSTTSTEPEAIEESTEAETTETTETEAAIINRLDAATARMQNIIDRINSRIEKLSERGVDTTEAERHMTNAQDAVDAALVQLAGIDAVVNQAVTSEDPRGSWQDAKTEFLAIKETLRSAHESLRSAVAALKEAVAETEAGTGVSEADATDEDGASTDE